MLRTLLLPLLFLLVMAVGAQTPLRVGVSSAPPYCIEGEEGQWSGMAVQLWRMVAEQEQLRYTLIAVPHPDSLDERLRRGELDVVLLGNLNAGKEREIDFLQAYHHSALGIALPKRSGLWTILEGLFTLRFLYIVVGLSVLLLVVGALVYFLERGGNGEQFGGDRNAWQGIGSGFWWAGVTMTTIGYGDKAPRTLAGRAVAMLWMLVALAVTSSLTAAIIAATEAPQAIKFPEALRSWTVGVVDESPAAAYLASRGQSARVYDSVRDGLRALQDQELDAVVADITTLRYVIDEFDGLSADLETTDAEPESYAFAVSQGSPLRESLNQAVIRITLTQTWREIKKTYDASQKASASSTRARR